MVSIIVPMYNAEKYVDRCLSSILEQSYENIEVIVINDGSTDSSFEHASAFSESDKRVHVISQDNHGLVYSRKQGIMRASGEYTLFVDSDDYIEPDMVEILVRIAEDNDADAVLSGAIFQVTGTDAALDSNAGHINRGIITEKRCRVVRNFVEEGFYEGKELDKLKQKLFCAEDYCTMAILPYLWNKLWRTSVIRNFVLECDENIRVGEDVAIGFPALLSAERVILTNKAYYHYCQYPDSMMRAKRDEDSEFNNAIRLYEYLLFKCIKNDSSGNLRIRHGIERYLASQLFTRCYGQANRLAGCNGMLGFADEIPDSVIIYGAGELGKSIYNYLDGKCHVRAWIDAAYVFYQRMGFPVRSPEDFSFERDDVVIVAVFSVNASKAIRRFLCERGVCDKNIYTVSEKVMTSGLYTCIGIS